MYYSYNQSSKSATIYVKVKTGSRQDHIEGFSKIENVYCLKITIRELPIDGKANKSIIKFLAKTWHLKQTQIEISKGQNQRIKKISIYGITEGEMEKILEAYA